MATAEELELPAEEFALRETFSGVPDVEFDIERVVAHDRSRLMPILWAGGDEFDAVDGALERNPSVENVKMLVDLDDEWLYQMDWVERIGAVVRSLVYEDGTVTGAHGRNDRWSFRIVFPGHDALSRTYQYCQEQDLTVDVASVTAVEEKPAGQFGLSDAQY